MQRNWIGRFEGIEMQFGIAGRGETLPIYTTRPDTVMGVTFVAVAPEHPLAHEAAVDNPAVQDFIASCRNTRVAEADMATLEKRGVDTGFKAGTRSPASRCHLGGQFRADGIRHGAVMAVPAHDQRDYEFARKNGIAVRQCIPRQRNPGGGSVPAAFVAKGILVIPANCGLTRGGLCGHRGLAGTGRKGPAPGYYRLREWGAAPALLGLPIDHQLRVLRRVPCRPPTCRVVLRPMSSSRPPLPLKKCYLHRATCPRRQGGTK
jgi:leucyl-tRNA synthetase